MTTQRSGRSTRGIFLALVWGCLLPSAFAQQWPMQNGSHDVLHSYQNPFSFEFGIPYFHEGVDIRGNLANVVAMRSGAVMYVDPLYAGGTVGVLVTGGAEFESYLHMDPGPWNVGDPIQAGDVLGTVSDSYFEFSIQDHLHVNRFDGWAGDAGYIEGRANMLDPLAIFSQAADIDPQLMQAQPQDADGDGVLFRVVRATDNNHELPIDSVTGFPVVLGDVDLVLEATDRLGNTLVWNQGLKSIGYWIEAPPGGEDVRSAADPYMLVNFNDVWRASAFDCDLEVHQALDLLRLVHLGMHDTGWPSLANYLLTNTKGTLGTCDLLDSNQFWRSDASIGSGIEPNASDSARATNNSEARFPDGIYTVHCLTGDGLAVIDTPFNVVVDNFNRRIRNAPTPTVTAPDQSTE